MRPPIVSDLDRNWAIAKMPSWCQRGSLSGGEMCRDQLLQYRIIYAQELWTGVCLDPDGEEESFETAGSARP